MEIRCDICKDTFEVDENNVDKKLNWMQCPICGAITNNPLKE